MLLYNELIIISIWINNETLKEFSILTTNMVNVNSSLGVLSFFKSIKGLRDQ